MSENNLTNLGKNDDGATGVAQDIAGHASLTYLNLSHSRLDTPSLMALATALQVPPHSIPPCSAGVPLRVPFQRSKTLTQTHTGGCWLVAQTNDSLIDVRLDDNALNVDCAKALADALKVGAVAVS